MLVFVVTLLNVVFCVCKTHWYTYCIVNIVYNCLLWAMHCFFFKSRNQQTMRKNWYYLADVWRKSYILKWNYELDSAFFHTSFNCQLSVVISQYGLCQNLLLFHRCLIVNSTKANLTWRARELIRKVWNGCQKLGKFGWNKCLNNLAAWS